VAEHRVLTGWGLTAGSGADVVTVGSPETAIRAVRDAGARGLVARGLGRSYGDAAQNAGGTVLDLTALDQVHLVDTDKGIVDVDAGVSLDHLMKLLLPLGWFVPVTPGTRYVTVGGAIASDIHGKNHHVEGTFSRHVQALQLLTGDGEVRTCSPTEHPEVFWATAGGMGLTGVILRVRLQVLRVHTSLVQVDTERVPNIDDLMARMVEGDDAYRYSVAWIDTMATGASTGRAVLTRGDHATFEQLSAKQQRKPLSYKADPKLAAPPFVPGGLLNRATVMAFNELWYRKAPVRHTGLESIPTFFHPLDGVLGWNRIYGPGGFIQYQYAVPDGAHGEGAELVRESLRRLSAAHCPSFLAVLKRFGPANPGPLSFPLPGWTLALDVAARHPGLGALCDELDELVVEAGGRVYLSKDSRLRPDVLTAMYPRLDEWRETRAKLDPSGVFVSDLSRRLGLHG
jgi:decaprenylphospho-beta-D-ribofuranose 2-oxidase